MSSAETRQAHPCGSAAAPAADAPARTWQARDRFCLTRGTVRSSWGARACLSRRPALHEDETSSFPGEAPTKAQGSALSSPGRQRQDSRCRASGGVHASPPKKGQTPERGKAPAVAFRRGPSSGGVWRQDAGIEPTGMCSWRPPDEGGRGRAKSTRQGAERRESWRFLQEVRSVRAVLYFSAVRVITLSGRRGAGGSWFQSTEFR